MLRKALSQLAGAHVRAVVAIRHRLRLETAQPRAAAQQVALTNPELSAHRQTV